jgi:hypothetical protein
MHASNADLMYSSKSPLDAMLLRYVCPVEHLSVTALPSVFLLPFECPCRPLGSATQHGEVGM